MHRNVKSVKYRVIKKEVPSFVEFNPMRRLGVSIYVQDYGTQWISNGGH